MVVAGRISRDAAWLYTVLTSYVNGARGDRKVWPSRTSLAQRMGLRKADSVDQYLRELEREKLVVTTAKRIGGMKARNDYEVCLPSPIRYPLDGGTLPALRGNDARPTGVRSPVDGVCVTPPAGLELEEVELDQDQLDQDELDKGLPPLASLASSQATTMTTPASSNNKRSTSKAFMPPAQRRANEHARAKALILDYTHATHSEADTLIAYYREEMNVAYVGAYVHAILHDDGEDKVLQHLAEAHEWANETA